MISIRSTTVTSKFIHSEKPGQAWSVPVDNILDTKEKHISLTLGESSTPILYDFSVSTHTNEYVKVWFDIFYDANGPRELNTEPLILGPAEITPYSK